MTAPIRACVFDAYGTLLDVHSAVGRHAARLGEIAPTFSQTWRSKQLEYSWVSSLMHRYRDFWALTGAALDFAMERHGIVDAALRADLLEAYRRLDAYPEVRPMLAALKAAGVRTAILSNGSPAMLESAIVAAGIADMLDATVSVDEIGIYKPDPRVYQLCLDRLHVTAAEVTFQSSNAWDIAGANAAGLRTFWINRTRQPREYLAATDLEILDDLTQLPARIGAR